MQLRTDKNELITAFGQYVANRNVGDVITILDSNKFPDPSWQRYFQVTGQDKYNVLVVELTKEQLIAIQKRVVAVAA